MIPWRVFLVTVLLKYHPRRALALLLRKVGGARRQKERKGPQRYWRDGHIYRPMPNLAMDLALEDRREQAAERALAGSGRRKRFKHPGKSSVEYRSWVQPSFWSLICKVNNLKLKHPD